MVIVTAFLTAFWAVFAVVDPIATVPVFLSISDKRTNDERRRIALRASIVGAALLIVFTFFGQGIFRLFGINLSAFRIAGGLLLLLTALDMFRAKLSDCRCTSREEEEGHRKDDPALVPLATPLLAGPGAIATVMVLSAEGGAAMKLALLSAIVITFGIGYVALRGAAVVQRVLGASGIAILQRVMGLILAAMAMQFIAVGAKELWRA